MNILQTIGFIISRTPLNGKVDNEISELITQEFKGDANKFEIYSLVSEATRFIVTTKCDKDVDILEKQIMSKAEFYFYGTEEPLVLDLMICHPAFPTLPKQLFEMERGEVETFAKYIDDNPYFESENDASHFLTRAYLAISKLCGGYGINEDGSFIESIEVDVDGKSFKVNKQADLNESVRAALLRTLEMKYQNEDEVTALIEHFIINFMSGMTKQNAFAPKRIMYNGQPAVQNHFEPKEWSDEHKAKSFFDNLAETSFEQYDGCPAYMPHYERFARYCRGLIQHLGLFALL